jgi:hypothetical protein
MVGRRRYVASQGTDLAVAQRDTSRGKHERPPCGARRAIDAKSLTSGSVCCRAKIGGSVFENARSTACVDWARSSPRDRSLASHHAAQGHPGRDQHFLRCAPHSHHTANVERRTTGNFARSTQVAITVEFGLERLSLQSVHSPADCPSAT